MQTNAADRELINVFQENEKPRRIGARENRTKSLTNDQNLPSFQVSCQLSVVASKRLDGGAIVLGNARQGLTFLDRMSAPLGLYVIAILRLT